MTAKQKVWKEELLRRTAELNKLYDEKSRRSHEETQAAMLKSIAATLIEIAVYMKD